MATFKNVGAVISGRIICGIAGRMEDARFIRRATVPEFAVCADWVGCAGDPEKRFKLVANRETGTLVKRSNDMSNISKYFYEALETSF